MFQTLPFRFPIFNIADIFITLGFLTFLIHFIVFTIKSEKAEKAEGYPEEDDYDDYDERDYDMDSGEFAGIDAAVATQAKQELAFAERTTDIQRSEVTSPTTAEPQMDSSPEYNSYPHDDAIEEDYHEPIPDPVSDSFSSLDEIDMELGSLSDYNVDDILREYGFEDD